MTLDNVEVVSAISGAGARRESQVALSRVPARVIAGHAAAACRAARGLASPVKAAVN